MAQRIETTLIDDIDGTPAVRTVRFTYGGTSYVIDLSDAHASALDDALAPYIRHARRDTTQATARPRATAKPRRTAGHDPAAVRAWATENGYNLAVRGRIPGEVITAYERATQGDAA